MNWLHVECDRRMWMPRIADNRCVAYYCIVLTTPVLSDIS